MKIHFLVFVVFVAWLVAAEGVSDPFIIGGNERGEESRERKSAFARRLLNAHSEQEVMIKGGLKMKRKHRDRIIATQKAFKARQSASAKKTKESFREVADKSISAANAAKTVTTQEKGITTPNPQIGGADDKSQKSSGTKQWAKLRNARRAVQRGKKEDDDDEDDDDEETSSTCCA